ncbi:MAG: nucleotidyltransferase family protein [Halobacteriota archaeon]
MTDSDSSDAPADEAIDNPVEETIDGIPVVTPPFDASDSQRTDTNPAATDHRTTGLLLAAGTSSRYGDQNKLLASVEGEPIVVRAARTLLSSSLGEVIVVVGYEADRVRAALEGLSVTIVSNPAYESGQASSVRTGIEAVIDRPAADAVLLALGDMPFVDPETIDTLCAAHRGGVGDAIAPVYDGERGNPVLFDRRHFDRLAAVEGDVGGRSILLTGDHSVLVAVCDPGVRRDVDEPSDL